MLYASGTMSNTKSQPPVRSRKLAAAGKSDTKKVIATLAREFYVENQTANAHGRKATAARKKLLATMQGAGIASDNVTVEIEGKQVPLELLVETPLRVTVDVRKLAKLVPLEDLLDVVSATQSSVRDKFGSHILPQVSTEAEGTTNVTISVPKIQA